MVHYPLSILHYDDYPATILLTAKIKSLTSKRNETKVTELFPPRPWRLHTTSLVQTQFSKSRTSSPTKPHYTRPTASQEQRTANSQNPESRSQMPEANETKPEAEAAHSSLIQSRREKVFR